RLARFSKIAGEMVPHGRIEEALCNLLGAGRCAVTGIPDDRRGESLAVLFVQDHVTPRQMIAHLEEAGLPALWIPKQDGFISVDRIPVLATGKTDLRAVKSLALAHAAEGVAA